MANYKNKSVKKCFSEFKFCRYAITLIIPHFFFHSYYLKKILRFYTYVCHSNKTKHSTFRLFWNITREVLWITNCISGDLVFQFLPSHLIPISN